MIANFLALPFVQFLLAASVISYLIELLFVVTVAVIAIAKGSLKISIGDKNDFSDKSVNE